MAVCSNQPSNLEVRVIQIHYVHLYLQNGRKYSYQIIQYYGAQIHTVGQNDSIVFHLPWNNRRFYFVLLVILINFLYKYLFKTNSFKYIWICCIFIRHRSLRDRLCQLYYLYRSIYSLKRKHPPSPHWCVRIWPQICNLTNNCQKARMGL